MELPNLEMHYSVQLQTSKLFAVNLNYYGLPHSPVAAFGYVCSLLSPRSHSGSKYSCMHEILQHLIIRQLKPRLLAVGEDLPHDDAEAPHVTLSTELPVHDAFGWHPANGQHGVTAHLEENRLHTPWLVRQHTSHS